MREMGAIRADDLARRQPQFQRVLPVGGAVQEEVERRADFKGGVQIRHSRPRAVVPDRRVTVDAEVELYPVGIEEPAVQPAVLESDGLAPVYEVRDGEAPGAVLVCAPVVSEVGGSESRACFPLRQLFGMSKTRGEAHEAPRQHPAPEQNDGMCYIGL